MTQSATQTTSTPLTVKGFLDDLATRIRLRDRVPRPRDIDGVEVHSFSGLLVDFMRKMDADVVVRGIRAVSDYEYELQMALMNRELHPGAETIFMLPSVEYTFVASRLVKEVFRLGGDIAHLVPAPVLEALRQRLSIAT